MIQNLIEISKKAGDAILGFYEKEIETDYKSDHSPLTKADLAAHHIIVDSLKALYPDIPVISEESGIPDYNIRNNWQRYFLVDPLDGTKEFIKKNGEFTVNIALIENNIPTLGIVHVPAMQVTYYGGKEMGAFKLDRDSEPEKISHTPFDKSKPASVVVSRSHGSDKLADELKTLGITIGEQIPSGSSIKFCLVAEGIADIYPRLGPTMEWDTAAGDAIYRYSGKNGERKSPLKFNKEDLLNPGFIIGV